MSEAKEEENEAGNKLINTKKLLEIIRDGDDIDEIRRMVSPSGLDNDEKNILELSFEVISLGFNRNSKT